MLKDEVKAAYFYSDGEKYVGKVVAEPPGVP
jgi:hypothetical protein